MTDFASRYPRIFVTDAIAPAFNYMAKVLFKPFSFVKWLKLGLVAFLVSLGGGGVGFNSNFNLPFNDKSSSNTIQKLSEITQWAQNNLTLIIIIAILAVLLITIIWTILIYFSSRFSFVYLDGVVKNDLQIKRAYKENRTNGWSYFLWNIIFVPTALLVILLLTAVPATILVLIGIKKGFTVSIILLLIFTGLVLIGLIILLAVITLFTIDFVLPIMYLRKARILEGWKILLTLMRNNKGQFFLYLLMRIVLGFVSLTILIIPCCLVGCIFAPFYMLMVGLVLLALKYPLIWIIIVLCGLIINLISSFVYQTIFSPVTVFFRVYPLIYLEGFGDEFAMSRFVI
jgi:hypothetical protein